MFVLDNFHVSDRGGGLEPLGSSSRPVTGHFGHMIEFLIMH